MELALSNIKIIYTDADTQVLDIHHLKFNEGINFLIGNNGSGKSTLLKALSNFNDEVRFNGEIKLNNKKFSNDIVGLVTQNPLQSVNIELTFLENILLANTNAYQHLSFLPQQTSESRNRVIYYLKEFKNWEIIKPLLDKEVHNLSSGQQQILAILMRVMKFKQLLLLDECTANLDNNNVGIIMDILTKISNEGTIIIFATHQKELLQTNNSKIYKVENGTIKKNIWK